MLGEHSGATERLDQELVAWLTTVDSHGQAQPSAIWFVVADDGLVIYSKSPTPRLRNIAANPRVAVHLNSDSDGDGLLIIEGVAEVIGTEVPPSQDAAYVAKYDQHLSRWDFTWESYDAGFPVRIHVRPTRIRG